MIKRTTTANTGFVSGGLTCKLGALCFYSSSALRLGSGQVLADSIVLRNRLLLVAAYR